MSRCLPVAAVTLAALLAIAPAAHADWVWPVGGEVITPYRNGDDPYAAGQHRGIDIAAPVGTSVVAAAGGEVRFAGTAGSSGLTVSIRTADGLLDTSYLHLSSAAVHEGDRVSAGDRVGAVGTTGRRSAETAHLHFGVRDAGTDHGYHDPLDFLPPTPGPAERPRPAPAPLPAPPPPEPAPIRGSGQRAQGHALPSLAPAPSSSLAPAPSSSPAKAPHLQPAPVPTRAAVPTSSPAPSPQRPPASHRLPSARSRAAPRARNEGVSHPTSRVEPSRGAAANGARDAAMSRPRPAAPRAGPDLGYALACVGLLLAAALLGLTEDGRRTTRRSRARAAALLRPLVSRRS